MVRSFTCGRFYHRLERDYIIYVHFDVNLDGRGWVKLGLLLLDLQLSEKKMVALLIEIEATCPLIKLSGVFHSLVSSEISEVYFLNKRKC